MCLLCNWRGCGGENRRLSLFVKKQKHFVHMDGLVAGYRSYIDQLSKRNTNKSKAGHRQFEYRLFSRLNVAS